MANELLDFVMSLVRDPETAARYTADPDRALAAAGLTGVTSADVNNLLPVVEDSIAMTAPPVGATGSIEGNVWTGGAATAAFDAFSPHPGGAAVVPHQPVISSTATAAPVEEPSVGADPQLSAPDPASVPVIETDVEAPVWDAPFEHHVTDDPDFSGFELLD